MTKAQEQIFNEAAATSHWDKAVRGVVKAPAAATCSCKGAERTIDYLWMGPRLAGAFAEGKTDQLAPSAPHKPAWVQGTARWSSFQIRFLKQPKQFHLDRPVGPMPDARWYPQVPAEGNLQQLDEAY